MKIMFAWRKIDGVSGGVERMSAAMMNAMIARGHQISFLTWDHEDAVAYYHLDDNISWYKLGIGDPSEKGSWATRFKRMKKVRRIVEDDKPDLIFNFESGIFLSMRLFLVGFNIPFVSAERNAPSRHKYSSNPNNKYKVFSILSHANHINVQFDRYKLAYPSFLQKKITAIHNPVSFVQGSASPHGKPNEKKVLLCVARLAYQKNIDVLIDAFHDLSSEFPDWILRIAGDGDDEKRIQETISKLDMKDKIELLGAVSDVSQLYTSSHLFCITSRYEGFPNALAESLSYGLPAVGFKECCGVRDLIDDGVTGSLADGNGQKAPLVSTLRTLMSNDKLREEMGHAAKKSVEIYAPEKIFDQWERFFKTFSA
jgi:glycosyltransferase involved in cell wall biosynthesis